MKNKSFFKLFEYITEIVGWIQIFISPLIVGCVIGYIAYYFIQNTLGIIIGVSIGLVGFISGIILANRSWKKGGTVKFLSRVISTPDIDKDLDDSKKQAKINNK
ncbi:hypothetical protein [Chryseobacterium sp. ISL-6]|uniref:hypothetical protein n=1 Tax=Chryseobacterium sp. ISL-6 TaxID=2819143 RepID=UPI001BEAE470|nr:hypothetical protein [Chryseobacterium sp. ISL-6]MBT2622618.1 hypothetical protein [Chryseobacterium sp. ISL-6]